MLNILLVDDEPTIRLTVGDALVAAGHYVTIKDNGLDGKKAAEATTFDVIVTDIRMPGLDGMQLFAYVRELSPTTDVIFMTAYGDVNAAVQALKEGAEDYLTKPFDVDELVISLARVAERRELGRQLQEARRLLAQDGPGAVMVGRSPVMVALNKRVETIARSDAAVVITGESGTGKELVARALHGVSPRAQAAFVAVNCAAFPETLIEAELFGHERGAFTGAARHRDGRFKAAHGGTLLLDEVGEIPPQVQAKLLRVLQDGVVEPLGTNVGVPVDVRILCATHRDLRQLIAEGRFREDLFFRLNVLDIHVPALRDRRGDLALLVEHFMRRYVPGGVEHPSIAPRVWAALDRYSFPGNIRELQHAVQHAVVLSAGKEIDLVHLPSDIAGTAREQEHPSGEFRELGVALKEFEREYLLRALNVSKGRRIRAAKSLGISRKNLWEKLRAHGISDSDLEDGDGN